MGDVHPLRANVPAIAEATLPANYQAAKKAIAECIAMDQVAAWADEAKAIAAYARMAEDDTLLFQAMRIRALSFRRCGELLKEIEPKRGARTDLGGTLPLSRKAAAEAAGLTDDERKDMLRVAAIPKNKFDLLMEGSQPVSINALAEMGTQHRPAEPLSREEEAQLAVKRVEQARADEAAREKREDEEAERAAAEKELLELLNEHLPPDARKRFWRLVRMCGVAFLLRH